ncbi:unnamed protein product [Colias eurytheme]|nr:unnamed protein product [Colias eurytheme]
MTSLINSTVGKAMQKIFPGGQKSEMDLPQTPKKPVMTDKLVGPPVYTGLTQSAVLLQMHTRLCELEEENRKIAVFIKDMQRAVEFLLSGEAVDPGSTQVEARTKALRDTMAARKKVVKHNIHPACTPP